MVGSCPGRVLQELCIGSGHTVNCTRDELSSRLRYHGDSLLLDALKKILKMALPFLPGNSFDKNVS